jgi:hypothetical protein
MTPKTSLIQRHLPLLPHEQRDLAFLLVESPNEAVKHCGHGYDVLRKAVLGEPVYDWVAAAILVGLRTWKEKVALNG